MPERAENWNRIGLFSLKDGTSHRLVFLYYYDSASVEEEATAKGAAVLRTYPNFFSAHAVVQTASGKWVHTDLFDHTRIRFVKVERALPDMVVLQCKGNYLLEPAGRNRNFIEALDRWTKLNEPFTKTVFFLEGRLTVK